MCSKIKIPSTNNPVLKSVCLLYTTLKVEVVFSHLDPYQPVLDHRVRWSSFGMFMAGCNRLFVREKNKRQRLKYSCCVRDKISCLNLFAIVRASSGLPVDLSSNLNQFLSLLDCVSRANAVAQAFFVCRRLSVKSVFSSKLAKFCGKTQLYPQYLQTIFFCF